MRHSPFATLALAAASLFPATLFAHSHHIKQLAAARHLPMAPARGSRIQHTQPAVFRRPDARKTSPRTRNSQVSVATRRSLRMGSSRTPRLSTPPRRTAGRRGRLRAADIHPKSLRASRRFHQADLQTPLTPVVSVIRPTSERPQLPSIQQAATEPIVLPTLYNERGRLVMPAPLFGSHEILVRQNELADQDGLGRVQDDADLNGMRGRGMLVAIPASEALRIDDRLPPNRRFCRPWTAQFLDTLARAYYARFQTPLQVNSAVRTVEFQLRLQRTNGNAAPAEGDTASPHLTGQAVDIAKRGLSPSQIAWLRGYLLPLIQESRVDVEEEFQQSCFHISVYRRYVPADTPPRYAAAARSTSALAVAIR